MRASNGFSVARESGIVPWRLCRANTLLVPRSIGPSVQKSKLSKSWSSERETLVSNGAMESNEVECIASKESLWILNRRSMARWGCFCVQPRTLFDLHGRGG